MRLDRSGGGGHAANDHGSTSRCCPECCSVPTRGLDALVCQVADAEEKSRCGSAGCTRSMQPSSCPVSDFDGGSGPARRAGGHRRWRAARPRARSHRRCRGGPAGGRPPDPGRARADRDDQQSPTSRRAPPADRMRSWTALEDAGLGVDQGADDLPWSTTRRRGPDRRRSAEHPPTAVFAFCDEVAMGALRSLRRTGIRCPMKCRSSGSTTLIRNCRPGVGRRPIRPAGCAPRG